MASLTRPTAKRAVHLRITPRPSNLGESRAILRLLSQFGEVDYFKNLKYDSLSAPNTALLIYKEDEAAQECFKRSPIRFRMGKATAVKEEKEDEQLPPAESREEKPLPRGPIGTPFGLAPHSRSMSTASLPKPPPKPIRMPFDPPPPASNTAEIDGQRIFQIQTSPSSRHFRDIINMGHYHGSFQLDTKYVGQEDLSRRVPTPGLSVVDWKAGERPWRLVKKERQADGKRKSLGEMGGKIRRQEEESGVEGEKNDVLGNDSSFKPFG